jgi:hypothetical protein
MQIFKKVLILLKTTPKSSVIAALGKPVYTGFTPFLNSSIFYETNG